MKNSMDRVHDAVDRGRHRSTVDRRHVLRGGSPEDGRNGDPVRGTSPRLRKKGEGTTVSLTDCKRGWRRDGNGRASVGNNWWTRRSVWAVLGYREKRREVGRGPVKPEVGAHPFIGAGEGHAGRERGNRSTTIAIMPLKAGSLMRG
jgi:hypothetical protein